MIVFLVLALSGFVASLAVHASTFAAAPHWGMSQTWFLHVGIFIVFLPMVLVQRQNGGAGGNLKDKKVSEQFGDAPGWMRGAMTVFFVYAIVNFVLMIVNVAGGERGGKMSTRDGRHVLVNRGQVVREVSEREYLAHEARVARGFSGHWMVFYLASFVGIYDAMVRRRRARAAAPWPPVLPATIRNTNRYERAPTPRMSPWLHATVGGILTIGGFFAGPALMISVFALLWPHGNRNAGGGWFCLVAPLFFGSAIVGFTVPARVYARRVAAACPACGGRAYADGPVLRGRGEGEVRYTCRDCGRVSRTDGSEVEAGPLERAPESDAGLPR